MYPRFMKMPLLLFLIFCPSLVFADEIKFEHLYIEDGLSQSSIFAIYQDREGFLWFGTQDGLNRYDGYFFKVYRYDSQDSTSISDNYIQVISGDDYGNLWIGTVGGGLNRFDPRSGCFKSYKHLTNDSTTLSNNNVSALLVEENGIVWVGTIDGGLNKFDTRTGKFVRYGSSPNPARHEVSNSIYSIIRDAHQRLWIGSGRGLYEFDEDRALFINRDEQILNHAHHKITSIFADEGNTLWLAVDLRGLVSWIPGDKAIQKYSAYPVPAHGKFNIRVITRLDSSRLLVGTFDDGLYVLNPGTGSFSQYGHDDQDQFSLSDNHVMSFWIDGSRILWIGTLQGLNKFDLKPSKFRHIKIDTRNTKNSSLARQSGVHFVLSVLQDHQGNIWYGSYGAGLFKLDGEDGRSVNFVDRLDSTGSIKGNDVWSLFEDSQQVIWIGTTFGLHAYRPFTGKFDFYQIEKSTNAYAYPFAVRGIAEDKQGNLWIGFDGLGLYYFDRRTGRFTSYTRSDDNHDPVIVNSCICLLIDREGIIWIGTNGAGLYSFDPDKHQYTQYEYNPGTKYGLCSYRVNTIYEDSHGLLWLGTSNGLNIFDKRQQSFICLTEKNGLPNSFIYAIEGDEFGNIWMTSNRGLTRVSLDDANRYAFRNYDVEDGLQSNEFNTNCSFRSSSGEMFFGGVNGISAFYPARVIDNYYIPNITITSLTVDDLTTYRNPSKSSLGLKYDQNSFRFEFAAMDFSNPRKNQFEYRLEGFDKKWLFAAKGNQANYTNISPGNYVFRVRGSNNDGIWNEEGTWVNISISPPFWQSTIAYILYVLFLLGLIYTVIKWRSIKLERAKQRLERIVTQKTQELQKSYEQLKLSQIELIRSAKLKAMGKLASGMAHDFNNILAIILGSVQLLRSNTYSPKELKLIQNIETAAWDGSQIIKKIQDFSRQNIESESILIDLNQVLRDVIEVTRFQWLTEKQLQEIKIDFNTELEDLPLLRSNISDLRLIFTNIIINAIESFERSGKITIRTHHTPATGYTVQVIDEGKGIEKEALVHIFDPFFTTKGVEGNGLGLSQVYGLVTRLDGTINVQSDMGKGTTMTINIPDSLRTDPVGGENKNENNSLKVKKGKSIFIVEDESTIRDLYKDMLGMQGYSIFAVESGEEGLKHWDNDSFDLILCDLGLPGMNGWEFIARIRQQNASIPIIALTGWGDMISSQEAADHQVQKVISKPVQFSQFSQIIYDLL
jgi:ligand-binding sensor domain-containing protein/signal transduction histidine kinase/CheY-like chemotaxis protein